MQKIKTHLIEIGGLLVLLFGCIAGYAQTVTVQASHFGGVGTEVTGTIYWAPAMINGRAASFHQSNGGIVPVTPVQAPVTAGAFSITLPDTTLTTPQNVCYIVTATSTKGPLLGPGFTCVQPHGTATGSSDWCQAGVCNFDNYTPYLPALPVQYITSGSFLPLLGGTLTGPLILSGDPTSNLGAATKQYVDNHAGSQPDWNATSGLAHILNQPFTTATGSGQGVLATSPTITTPTFYNGATFTGAGVPIIGFNGDTGLSRDSAGVLDLGNGSAQDQSGSLYLTNLHILGTCTGCGSASWGSIGGALSSQTDLATALAALAPTSTTVNGHPLSSNVVVSASDLTTGILPHAQLPSLVSGDIPNNAANTSGTAAGLSAAIAESQVTNLTTDLAARVQTTTTVNSHPLSSNVVVSASDLTTGTLPHAQLPSLVSGDIPNNAANTSGTAGGLSAAIAQSQVTGLTAALAGLTPTSTTVNGHALSSNVVVSASDLTTGTLPHAQLPSLVSGDIPNNAANTSGTAGGLSAAIAESQVTNLTTDLAARVQTTTTVNGHALSSNVVVSASDLTTGTLPHAQLPSLVSGDIPNNAANTSGSAGTVPWSGNTAPTAALALTMPLNDSTSFTWTGGARTAVNYTHICGADTGTVTLACNLFQDTTGNTDTGPLMQINTVGTSTAIPLQVTAQGTSNGVSITAAGLLQAIGTGGIKATSVNGNTFPGSAGFTAYGFLYAPTTSSVSSTNLTGNALVKSATGGPAASSIIDNGVSVNGSEPTYLSSHSTTLTPASGIGTTATSTGIAFPATTTLAAKTYPGHCRIIWQQITAVSTLTFSVANSAAPTAEYVTSQTSAGAYSAPYVASNITSTTTTAVTATITPSNFATNYITEIDVFLSQSTTANTVTIYATSGSATDTITIQPGSYCSWLP